MSLAPTGEAHHSAPAIDGVAIKLGELRRAFAVRHLQRVDSGPTRSVRYILGLFGIFVVSVAIAGALWMTIPAMVPGWTSVVMSSDSMAPAIQRGDVVIAAPTGGVGLGQGTVVVFEDPEGSGLVTHRIVGLNADATYRTRGDANPAPDSTPLRAEQIVGVGRMLVPLAGLPIEWLSTRSWLPLAAWFVVLVASLSVARYAVLDRYDPWVERQVWDNVSA